MSVVNGYYFIFIIQHNGSSVSLFYAKSRTCSFIDIENTFCLLGENKEITPKEKYQAYLKLRICYSNMIEMEGKIIFLEKEKEKECLDKAMEIVLEEYGEKSLEIVKVYIAKISQYQYQKDTSKQLEYIKKAMLILVEKGGIKFQGTITTLYNQLWRIWQTEYEIEHGIKRGGACDNSSLVKAIVWIYQNISQELAINIIGSYGTQKSAETIARMVYGEVYNDEKEKGRKNEQAPESKVIMWIYEYISKELAENILKNYENAFSREEINNILKK